MYANDYRQGEDVVGSLARKSRKTAEDMANRTSKMVSTVDLIG